MSPIDWPVAGLGPLRRAKVLASAIPSASWVEGVLDAPYETTWSWITDLAHSVPAFDSTVTRVTVQHRLPSEDEPDVESVRMRARTYGIDLPFKVRIEDGFCLMRGVARLYLVVMAAEPEDGGQRTRFLHLEAIPLPGSGFLRPLIRREVRSDFARLAGLAARGFESGED